MPKVLGTIPEAVEDPILIEIFGLNPGSIQAVQNPDAAKQTVLQGVAAAKGTGHRASRGCCRAPTSMHRLEPGSILVCESTSPSWTPGLRQDRRRGVRRRRHALARRDRRPRVRRPHRHRGRASPRIAIADGDEIEVDGTNGTVTILKRAAELVAAR